MEKIVEKGLLYDFYGELLTEHQRQIYEDAVYNDMSLGEIASDHGISRQGVHDLIKRCNHILDSYEEKLHLVQKFTDAKQIVEKINSLAESEMDDEATRKERLETIKRLSKELIDQF